MSEIAAIGYAGLAALPILVQLALSLGAPWGVLTLGGRWPGTLPPALRVVTVLQAALLGAMAAAMLTRAGLIDLPLPGWSYPAALALTVLTLVSNTITPSRPERRLWMPVTGLMLLCGIGTGFF
jgi:hypothetical protein